MQLHHILFIIAAILFLIGSIIVIRDLSQAKHDNEVIHQYNKEMDQIRTERLKEAQRKTRELQKKKTYYTTYNEIEPNTKVTMSKEKRDELAKYAKWRFNENRRNKKK